MQGKNLSKKMRWNYFYDDKVSIFTKIAERYDWKIIGKPMLLSGGFMHKMYKIDTQQGTFALKLLNPFVMQRETAMDNFAKAERIEFLLEQQGVPILPALSLDGRKMQEVDGEHFYLFDYFPGKALQGNEITAYHCKEMGMIIALLIWNAYLIATRLWNCLNWHCAGQDMKIAKLIFSYFNLFYRGTKMPMGICPWIGKYCMISITVD